MDEHILIDTRIRDKPGKLETEVHNKAIGIANELCPDCKEKIGEGTYMIEIDPAKTEDMRNPWRTGNIIGVTRSFWERNFDAPFPPKQVAYVEAPIVSDIQQLERHA
jgi:hypothetical protein